MLQKAGQEVSISTAVPANVTAVFGTPGEFDSIEILENLISLEGDDTFIETLLDVFEWARDVLDSSVTGQTDEERAHLLQSLRLVEAVLATRLSNSSESDDGLSEEEGDFAVFTTESPTDEDGWSIPGFYPEATEIGLIGPWRLYIPLGVGVPTLRHEDNILDFVIPVPGPKSWEVLDAMSDLKVSQDRSCAIVLLTETLRLYAERNDDGSSFEFRYWNAGVQELPFTISEPCMADLVSSLREAVLWLSVYSVAPPAEGDSLLRAASSFVSDRPLPPIVRIKADPRDWEHLLLVCGDRADEAAATFLEYRVA